MALKRITILLAMTALVFVCSSPASASTIGKIAGIVTDMVTGEPLQGATVQIKVLGIATQADSDGEFFIINMPVGKHTLTVSMLGFETINLQEVRVLMDLTTPADFPMRRSPIHLEKSVTVIAQRPVIQRDKTSSGSIITGDEISTLANSRNILSVISNMAGTVLGSGGELHVRGGRHGAVTYFYDGFSIMDPFTGDLGIRVVPEALEELSLTSGGLAPEYGEALSGVVNSITRQGGDEFRGRLKFYEGATHTYDVTTGEFGGLELTQNRSMVMDISGPVFTISERLSTFFGSVELLRDDGYLPHNKAELWSATGKLVVFPVPKTKVTINGSYSFIDRQYYNHRDVNGLSYDFNLDGSGKIEREAYLFGVKFDYNKSANTVISIDANRFRTKTKVAPEHLFDLHWKQWPGYAEYPNGDYDPTNGSIEDSNYNASSQFNFIGFTYGDDYNPYYLDRFAAYTSGRFSILSQLDKYNQIKIGGDLRRSELYWDNRQFYNQNPYGETYEAFPWYGAAYIQDKVELNDMVLNVGLRFDYLNTNIDYWHNPLTKDYRVKAKAKTQWSPRLGISHPVSENSVLHFNYGYLFQPPNVRLMFTNLQGDLETGYPLIGNPDLDAEKTVYYELGWVQMLNENLSFSVTTYYRDIREMIGAREIVDEDATVYTVYTNSDYGSSKGFDFSLESIDRRFLNWSASYSYMIASGNASSPNEWYYDYYTIEDDDARPPTPTREYPLTFDQRHKLTAVVDFRVPQNGNLKIGNFNLPDAWGINLLALYNSGMPYTRIADKGVRSSLNGERMPYTLRFDMRFNKDFYVSGPGGAYLTLFVEAENLFDRRNVVDVYRNTGSADNDGSLSLATTEEDKLWYRLMSFDPQNFDHPRRVRVGMAFNF